MYFDAYLREIGVSLPGDKEAFVLSLRYTFKHLAFSSEDDVWAELTRVFVRWYDFPSGFVSEIITYWLALHDDFINNYDCDFGYYYLSRKCHGEVTRDKQLEYVRSCAIRFLRMYDEQYYYDLLVK
ncbi:hypothetical protein RI049_14615 [Cedecea neteri]|uniref:hypothetical protein n=1 Tax=Cedecea neteri TaxID=158822 RepID=UPI002AA6EAB2|nr:hypothetical protein [Cedecea neteri]WPU21315.1 hypothetical protein RI049_14615 [Cedecea neteri]